MNHSTLKRLPFITIEGVDGAGKSSHLSTIFEILTSYGFEVVQTREPGGTELGEDIRTKMLRNDMSLQTTVLLAFASRSELLQKVIRPALSTGKAVLCDRFTDSTYTYQGAGDGYPMSDIEMLEKSVHGDLNPDLTLLFDLPVEESMRRLTLTEKVPDNFEKKPMEYFHRVRQAYLDRAQKSNGRIALIDSNCPMEEVKQQVQKTVIDFLQAWSLNQQWPSKEPSTPSLVKRKLG